MGYWYYWKVSYDIYREVKLQKSIYQENAKGIKQLIKAR